MNSQFLKSHSLNHSTHEAVQTVLSPLRAATRHVSSPLEPFSSQKLCPERPNNENPIGVGTTHRLHRSPARESTSLSLLPSSMAPNAQHQWVSQTSATPQHSYLALTTAPTISTAPVIPTTTPAAFPPPHRHSLYHTIPLPPFNEEDPRASDVSKLHRTLQTMGPASTFSQELRERTEPILHPVLASARLSTMMSDTAANLSIQHWSAPATDPGVRYLTILRASTGEMIHVRPVSKAVERVVTIGDVVTALHTTGIMIVGCGGVRPYGHPMDFEDEIELEEMQLVRNALMLWWEPSEEEPLQPWYLLIGR
ncbi:hypothetical protein C0995_009097 [Termitomyces sp. Mi166|nr:hypothetical protein C0995_009097 [Termitomyces sp. Mi166\